MASADHELERLLEEGPLTAPRATHYARLFLAAVPNNDIYSAERLGFEFRVAMEARDPELIDRYGPLESLFYLPSETLALYALTVMWLLQLLPLPSDREGGPTRVVSSGPLAAGEHGEQTVF